MDCKEIKQFSSHLTRKMIFDLDKTVPRKIGTVQYICTLTCLYICLLLLHCIQKHNQSERQRKIQPLNQERERGKREPIRCGKIYLHSNSEACCLVKDSSYCNGRTLRQKQKMRLRNNFHETSGLI